MVKNTKSAEMEQKRIEILRGLSVEQKIRAMFELRRIAKQLAVAGIKSQHPLISEEDLQKELARRLSDD